MTGGFCTRSLTVQLAVAIGSYAGLAKHVVVVGGGWGGFGAAYALLKAGIKVTILDASETPGGLSAGWRTPGGRSVEAGIKGYSKLHTTSSVFE